MAQAIVIIDTWDNYLPGHNYLTPVIEYNITRICKVLDRYCGPVVLACYDLDATDKPWKACHHLVEHYVRSIDSHIITCNEQEVNKFLVNHNVNTLNYMGFSLPGCIENRSLGIKNMQENYQCNVVIDCTVNLLSPYYTHADILHETYRYAVTSNYNVVFGEHL